MSFLVADFYVQRTVPGRGEVFNACCDRKFGRVGESHSIRGREWAGLLASDFSLTIYDEVGGNEF